MFQLFFRLVIIHVLGSLFLLPTPSTGSSLDRQHGHEGKITPFYPGDPNIFLDKNAIKNLNAGKSYITHFRSGPERQDIIVQDIHAPAEVVWSRILDYNNYARMIPNTVEALTNKVIHVDPTKNDKLSQITHTRMKVSVSFLELEFFAKYMYYPSLNSLTWTLDYTKDNDLDDLCGYWYVIPHPENSTKYSRLYYAIEVSMYDWIPQFFCVLLKKNNLKETARWVKKFSESKDVNISDGNRGPLTVLQKDTNKNYGVLHNVINFKRMMLPMVFQLFRNKKSGIDANIKTVKVQSRDKGEGEQSSFDNETKIKLLIVTWTRLCLLALVFVLVIYNCHLYLSQ